jgi:hypothetical protein
MPISTLKQLNTTLILFDGLCGFRLKNEHMNKNQWQKEGGVEKKEGGVAKK